jgi:TPR repeat protein
MTVVYRLILFTFLFSVITHATHAATAEEVFTQVAPSIVVVIASDAKGRLSMQGSGVVTDKGEVTTNCHVAKAGKRIQVRQGTKTYAATLRYADLGRDLCQLSVEGLTAPPVPMITANTLKVGQRVYAIGAPRGLELTLTEGLISSLRPYDESQLIQTDAAISPGSSGGGLFDVSGRLTGITSFQFIEGENLNFALPVDWIKEMSDRVKKITEEIESDVRELIPSQIEKEQDRTGPARYEYQPGIDPRLVFYHEQAKRDRAGQKRQTWKDFITAIFGEVKSRAMQGDIQAQADLGRMYMNGWGVTQNYAEAAKWLRLAATQGIARSQFDLAVMYASGLGVRKSRFEAEKLFRGLAERGNEESQYGLALLILEKDSPTSISLAASWLRRAAKQGYSPAQSMLSVLYLDGEGVPRDYVLAYMWINLAIQGGTFVKDSLRNRWKKMRDSLEEVMTQDQIAKAQELSSNWRRKSECFIELGFGGWPVECLGLKESAPTEK